MGSTELFALNGGYSVTPFEGLGAGKNASASQISERVYLKQHQVYAYTLLSDTPLSVQFGSIVGVTTLVIKSQYKIRVRVSSPDGTNQAFPVGNYFLLVNSVSPITALDLTRLPGLETRVEVFLGES